jgi:hypothetical protein
VLKRIFLSLVLVTLIAPRSRAEDARAALCAEHVRQFVELLDRELPQDTGHSSDFYQGMMAGLPAKGCNVQEVIAISATSRYFVEPYQQYAEYTIEFKSPSVVFSFGLRKDSGDIELPNATWIEKSF